MQALLSVTGPFANSTDETRPGDPLPYGRLRRVGSAPTGNRDRRHIPVRVRSGATEAAALIAMDMDPLAGGATEAEVEQQLSIGSAHITYADASLATQTRAQLLGGLCLEASRILVSPGSSSADRGSWAKRLSPWRRVRTGAR